MHTEAEQSRVVDGATAEAKSACDDAANETDADQDDEGLALEQHLTLLVVDAILNFKLLLCGTDANSYISNSAADAEEKDLDAPVEGRAELNANL